MAAAMRSSRPLRHFRAARERGGAAGIKTGTSPIGTRATGEFTMKTMFALAATAAFVLAAPAAAQAPTDPQIAHIAYTAGQIDVEAARQALQISHNNEVRAFAETMVRDHEAVNRQALALVQRLHVTPEANPVSASLTGQADATRERLSRLAGAAFDRAYVDNEIAFHRTVNEALHDTLIPAAHNGELKSLLESGLALFTEHQTHAEHLARSLR
jgi:putative membrane protein